MTGRVDGLGRFALCESALLDEPARESLQTVATLMPRTIRRGDTRAWTVFSLESLYQGRWLPRVFGKLCRRAQKRQLNFRSQGLRCGGGERRVAEIIDGVNFGSECAVDCAVPIWWTGHQPVAE